LARFEGDLRREVAVLEESAAFAGREGERYTFALLLAPVGSSEQSRSSSR
jgi:hypothetical protein